MNVLIDPYMLELNDESEISDSIPFYELLLDLCSSKQLHVYMYEDLIIKIQQRELQPFPICISAIRDTKLKESVLLLNNAFAYTFVNNLGKLNIDGCCGDLNIIITHCEYDIQSELEGNKVYSDFLYVLTTPCYTADLDLSEIIITGKKKGQLVAGVTFGVECSCNDKEFSRDYTFSLLEVFPGSDRMQSIRELRNMARNRTMTFVENPEIVKGDHHNTIQKNDFHSFREISADNKRVLKQLRYFGLSRIVFADYYDNHTTRFGNIDISNVKIEDSNDIVCGHLHCATGYKCAVELYFPKNVGTNIQKIVGRKLYYNEVSDLRDSLQLNTNFS